MTFSLLGSEAELETDALPGGRGGGIAGGSGDVRGHGSKGETRAGDANASGEAPFSADAGVPASISLMFSSFTSGSRLDHGSDQPVDGKADAAAAAGHPQLDGAPLGGARGATRQQRASLDDSGPQALMTLWHQTSDIQLDDVSLESIPEAGGSLRASNNA